MANVLIHSTALCESDAIGDGTRVWAFVHILPEAKVGTDCNICDGVFIEGDVIIGDRVTIKCGVQVWDGTRIGNDVFIGPNATLTNDPFPRSRQRVELHGAIIEDGASLGANCTILPGIRIGARAMIGAGAVVTHDVAPDEVVVGNPARPIILEPLASSEMTHESERRKLGGGSVKLQVADGGEGVGDLADLEQSVPFALRTWILVTDSVAAEAVLAQSAAGLNHVVVCVRGSCTIAVTGAASGSELTLSHANELLCVMSPTSSRIVSTSHDAVIACGIGSS